MTELVTAAHAEDIRAALKNSLYPGAADASVDMVLAYCKAGGLDPMTKPVHIVPMSVKKPGTRDDYEWRDVVMPGIELYRIKAHRTGEYAGQDEPAFGPTVQTEGVEHPEWCRVTVYRIAACGRVAYTAVARWRECYATQKRDSAAPNAMWRKRPWGQLEKCAEALALRKAFPEIGAQPTADEMAGKVLESSAMDEPARIEGPKRRSAITEDAERLAVEVTQGADRAAEPVPEQPKPAENVEGGIFLHDGQRKVLDATLKRAGKTDDDLLREFSPRVDAENLNGALRWARGSQA